MKKAKLIAIAALLILSVFALTACNMQEIIGNIFKGAIVDHEFTADGKEEVTKFFEAIKSKEGNYSIIFKSVYLDDGEEKEMTFTYSRKQNEAEEKTMYAFKLKNDDIDYRMLRLDEEDDWIYIDEKEKTFTTEPNIYVGVIVSHFMKYAVIEMADEEGNPNWEFAEKNDNVGIDFNGGELAVVQYTYNAAGEDDNTVLYVSFDKKSFLGLLAIIRKIEYREEGEDPIVIYVENPSASLVDADFVIPSDYTDLDAAE